MNAQLPPGRAEVRKCGYQLPLCLLKKTILVYVPTFLKLYRLRNAQCERRTGKEVAG
jgi:hypothetical protein